MPSSGRILEHVLPAVQVARAEIERIAPRYLSDGPCTTRVVAVQSRSHSTATVIELRGGRERRRFFLKTLSITEANRDLKRAQIAEEHRVLEDLSLRFQPYDDLGVITPVACWPDRLSMLTEEFPGEKLSARIGRSKRFRSPAVAGQVTDLCRRVGRWLGLFQAFTKPMDGGASDVGALLAYCDRRLARLGASPASGIHGLDRALVRYLERSAGAVSPADLLPVGCQNDFRPDNIMTDGRAIAVLDFTGFTEGPALYDFMKFWMKLEDFKHGLMFREAVVAGWQQAFREGYGAPVDLDGPLCRLLQVANVLDKMSEFVLPARSGYQLRRLVLASRHRAHVAWLRRVIEGGDRPC